MLHFTLSSSSSFLSSVSSQHIILPKTMHFFFSVSVMTLYWKRKKLMIWFLCFFFFLSRVCLCVVFLFCACPIEHYSPYLCLRLYVVWLFVTAIIKKPITQFPLSALKVIVNLTLFSICNFPFFLLNFASLLTQFQLRTILSLFHVCFNVLVNFEVGLIS